LSDLFDTISIDNYKRSDVFDAVNDKELIVLKQKQKILSNAPKKESPNILTIKPGEIPYIKELAAPDLQMNRFVEPTEPYTPQQPMKEKLYDIAINATAAGWANVISGGLQVGATTIENPFLPTGLGAPISTAGGFELKTPEQQKEGKRIAAELKEDAAFMWQVSNSPELVTERTDPFAKLVDMAGRTLPYITATSIGYGIMGPMGAFLVGTTIEGNNAYQTALEYFRQQSPTGELTDEQKEMAAMIGTGVGIISGAIESFGGGIAEGFLKKASQRLTNKIIRGGAVFSVGSLIEALEETGQEFAAITGESFYRDIDWKEALTRGEKAFAGGLTLGGLFKSGSASVHYALSQAQGGTQAEYMQNLTTLLEERDIAIKDIAKQENVNEEEALKILDQRVQSQMAVEIKPDPKQVAENLGISEEFANDIINLSADELQARQQTRRPTEVLPVPPEPSEGQTEEGKGKTTKEGEIVEPAKDKAGEQPPESKSQQLKQAEEDFGLTIEQIEEMLPLKETTKAKILESGQFDTKEQIEQFEQELQAKLEEFKSIIEESKVSEAETKPKTGEVSTERDLANMARWEASWLKGKEKQIAEHAVKRGNIKEVEDRIRNLLKEAEQATDNRRMEIGDEIERLDKRAEALKKISQSGDLGAMHRTIRRMGLVLPKGAGKVQAQELIKYGKAKSKTQQPKISLKGAGKAIVGNLYRSFYENLKKNGLAEPFSESKQSQVAQRLNKAWKKGEIKNIDDVKRIALAQQPKNKPSEIVKEPGKKIIPKKGQKVEKAKAEKIPPEQTKTENTEKVKSGVDEALKTDYTKATSAKIKDVAYDREAMGLDEINSPDRKKWKESLQAAKDKRFDRNASMIASEIIANPRPLTDEETAGLVIRMAELKSEHKQLLAKIKDTTDQAEIMGLSTLIDRIEDEFDLLSRAVTLSGTEKGRALAAQKLTINEDYDLISIKTRAKAAAGRKLKASEETKFEELTKKLDHTNNRVSELEKTIKELTATRKLAGRSRFKSMSQMAKDTELNTKADRLNELLRQGCNF
jgi:hypothetical protein